ncbi:lipopolysaccharide assembly protein LapB [Microvirgula sp. AG722]|uniref:tetratricopeptide repeat protein n=1 Tax=Microvirgula sp. AG722 TaxID=2183901 RepID=UPI001314DE98|nr:tetratricopeptide repeat protein [Microvirgula sp. AG722]
MPDRAEHMDDAGRRLDRVLVWLQADPAHAGLQQEAADLCYRLGRFDDARHWLTQQARSAPLSPAARSLDGLLLLRCGDATAAIAIFQALLAQGTATPELHGNLGWALALAGRFDEAGEHALRAVEGGIAGAGPLHVRILHHQARLDEAIRVAEDALAHDPAQLPHYGILATLYLDRDEPDTAAAFARKVRAQAPDDADANTVLGVAALLGQRRDEADRFFRHALHHQPHSGRARAGRGLVGMLDGHLETAEDHFRLAVADMPAHAGIWHGLAWCQLLTGRTGQAHASLQAALALDRTLADTHGGLAVLAALSGRPDEAGACIRRALGLDPGCLSALLARGLLLRQSGHAAAAQQQLDGLMNQPLLPDGTTLQQALATHVLNTRPRRHAAPRRR